ncbi:MAG: hypothetical protein AAF532_00265 [Planctomycetota bacterium]
MIKEILAGTSFATFAEIALLTFVTVFASIMAYAWFLSPEEADRRAAIPVEDGEPTDE